MLVEYKHGHEACEETTAAGATTTKQLARRRSTSAESEARQQQRMVWRRQIVRSKGVSNFNEEAFSNRLHVSAARGNRADALHSAEPGNPVRISRTLRTGHRRIDRTSYLRLSVTLGPNKALLVPTKAALVQCQHEETPGSLVLDFHRFGGRVRCPRLLSRHRTSIPR